MSALIAWLKNVANIFTYWLQELLRECVRFYVVLWGVIVIAAGIAWLIYQHTVAGINLMITHWAAILPHDSINHLRPSSVAYLFATANTFAPLDEAIALICIYLDLVICLAIYRLLKSWLPIVGAV